MPEAKKTKNVGENSIGDTCTLPGNRIGLLEAIITVENGEVNIEAGEIPYLEVLNLIAENDNTAWDNLGYLIRKEKAKENNTDAYMVELWRVDTHVKIVVSRGLITPEGKVRLLRVIDGKGAEAAVYYILPNVEFSRDDNDLGDILTPGEITNVSYWGIFHELEVKVFTPRKFHLYRKIQHYPNSNVYRWLILVPTPPSRKNVSVKKGLVLEVDPDQLNVLMDLKLIDAITFEMALVSITAESNVGHYRDEAAKLLDELNPGWFSHYFVIGSDAIIGFRKELGLADLTVEQ